MRAAETRDSTTTTVMLNLRELARRTEETAVLLEHGGYEMLARELVKVSERMVEVREALERLSGQSK